MPVKRFVPSHPLLLWLIYAVCSLLISAGIASWLGAKPQEKLGETALKPPPAAQLDRPELTLEPEESSDADLTFPFPAAPPEPPQAAPEVLEAPPEVLRELSSRELLVPVEGVDAENLGDNFNDLRSGGRRHRALDIMAPLKTPVVAVEGGRIAQILESPRGGLSLYHFDPSESYCYFYAHLDAYAPGLAEGDAVEPGQVLGYVGTTGNAPEGAPHLHFEIHVLPASRRCSRGKPVNPFKVFQQQATRIAR